jgi:hypothetical protein
MVVEARCVTGREAPLPTVMEGEWRRGWEEMKLPALDDMCEEALVSKYHSEA